MLGAIAAAGILYLIASGKEGFDAVTSGFAANGYGEHSPGGYNMNAALIIEVVMTFMFLLIILGSTDERAPKGFAGIAIGLGLTLIHLVSIPVTNTSVNPARSTGKQFLLVAGLCRSFGCSGLHPLLAQHWPESCIKFLNKFFLFR